MHHGTAYQGCLLSPAQVSVRKGMVWLYPQPTLVIPLSQKTNIIYYNASILCRIRINLIFITSPQCDQLIRIPYPTNIYFVSTCSNVYIYYLLLPVILFYQGHYS